MVPLEIACLPKNTDLLSIHIDGRRLNMRNSIFVTEHVLFVPVAEVSEHLKYYFQEQEKGYGQAWI